MSHDLEHCDFCWIELEESQIGLCDDCQASCALRSTPPAIGNVQTTAQKRVPPGLLAGVECDTMQLLDSPSRGFVEH